MKLLLVLNLWNLIKISESFFSQNRWCNVSTQANHAIWTSYNDTISACVKCGFEYKFFKDRSQVDETCCNGSTFTDNRCKVQCGGVIITCNNKNQFCVKTPQQSCDGYNDCGDGTDETNLQQITPNCTECSSGKYLCKKVSFFPQCFSQLQVCDGLKNCISGSDEVNCLYYGGRCKGFLCNQIAQCVPQHSVCDGQKDCYDGSDEQDCFLGCVDTFHCNVTGKTQVLPFNTCGDKEVIAKLQVCDGKLDCANMADETNCYIWTAWSAWQPCLCQNNSQMKGEMSRIRRCITHYNVNLHVEGKCNGSQNELNSCNCKEQTTAPATTTTPIKHTSSAVTVVTPTSLRESFIAIISVAVLAGLIFIVIIVLLIYACWNRRTLNKRKISITKNLQNNPLNTDHLFPPQSPLLQYQSSLQQTSSQRISPLSKCSNSVSQKNLNTPLPATPDSIEPGYESIADLRAKAIDPYAETKFTSVPFKMSINQGYESSAVSSPTLLQQRSESLMSLSSLGAGKERNPHKTPVKPHRQRTISRFPAEELGSPPHAPLRKTKSSDALGSDGYMIPLSSVKRYRNKSIDIMTSPSTNDSYATMQSPDHHLAPGHLKKYSRIGGVDSQRPIAAPRRRYRNKQNKGINSSRSMYVSTSSGKTPSEREYYSDTYASMNGSRRYKEDTHIDSGYDVSTKSLSKALSLEFTSFNVPECTTHYAQNISPPLCDHAKLNSKHSRSSDDLCLNTEIRRKTETIYTAIVNSTDEEERNDKMEDTKEDGVKIRKYTKVLPKTRKARYTTSDNEQIEKNAESLNESSHEYAKLSPDVSPNNAGYIEKEYSYDTIVRDDHTSQTEN